jgi:hypothetical protein
MPLALLDPTVKAKSIQPLDPDRDPPELCVVDMFPVPFDTAEPLCGNPGSRRPAAKLSEQFRTRTRDFRRLRSPGLPARGDRM